MTLLLRSQKWREAAQLVVHGVASGDRRVELIKATEIVGQRITGVVMTSWQDCHYDVNHADLFFQLNGGTSVCLFESGEMYESEPPALTAELSFWSQLRMTLKRSSAPIKRTEELSDGVMCSVLRQRMVALYSREPDVEDSDVDDLVLELESGCWLRQDQTQPNGVSAGLRVFDKRPPWELFLMKRLESTEFSAQGKE